MIPRELKRLRALLVDRLSEQDRIKELGRLTTLKFEELSLTIAVRRDKGFGAAQAINDLSSDWAAQGWQAAGHDRGSVNADPRFRNAGNGDFRLTPTSPALRPVFRQIDLSTVGPASEAGSANW